MNQNSKMLLGAVVAAALAVAVYYGVITQQTASNIQGQANQTLGTAPASQPASPAPQTPAPPKPPPQQAPPAPSGPAAPN